MIEAMPFLRKVNIAFLCPPPLMAGLFGAARRKARRVRYDEIL